MWTLRAVLVLFCFQVADFSDPPCIIELDCAECIPDNMPVVTSHRASNGSVQVPAGGELALACAGGKFLLYPLRAALSAVCEAGRYRVSHDRSLRHLLDLGCQESVFEDVLHQVEHCGSPMQGRAYQTQEPGRGVRHLATACFDADRGLALRLHATNAPRDRLALPPHEDRSSPLSILGNFNHMFDTKTRHDAEKLYSDDVRLNRRLRELFKHDPYSFSEQSLTAAKLLDGSYFEDQNARVSEFASNKVLSWKSVARGNLRSLQRDLADLLQRGRGARDLHVYAGTHGVLALGAGAGGAAAGARGAGEVFLAAGRRFPVPRYVWTVVHAARENRALALVLLNDPLVTVSEIREAVFCDSSCGSVSWLTRLRTNRNYERPVSGLVFCCSVTEFTERVPEMPKIFNATVQYLY